jgi:hypothetical protein
MHLIAPIYIDVNFITNLTNILMRFQAFKLHSFQEKASQNVINYYQI